MSGSFIDKIRQRQAANSGCDSSHASERGSKTKKRKEVLGKLKEGIEKKRLRKKPFPRESISSRGDDYFSLDHTERKRRKSQQ